MITVMRAFLRIRGDFFFYFASEILLNFSHETEWSPVRCLPQKKASSSIRYASSQAKMDRLCGAGSLKGRLKGAIRYSEAERKMNYNQCISSAQWGQKHQVNELNSWLFDLLDCSIWLQTSHWSLVCLLHWLIDWLIDWLVLKDNYIHPALELSFLPEKLEKCVFSHLHSFLLQVDFGKQVDTLHSLHSHPSAGRFVGLWDAARL